MGVDQQHRRRARGGALLAALAVLVTACTTGGAPPPGEAAPGTTAPAAPLATTYANPVFDAPVDSPALLRVDGTYHAYSAGTDGDGTIVVRSSPDLVTWAEEGTALPLADLGEWARPGPAGTPTAREVPGAPGAERFVLAYTATSATSGQPCIGVATAAAPTGPFTAADAPLLCPEGGASAPSVVLGTDVAQLVYVAGGQAPGIEAVRLRSDGQALVPGAEPVRLLDAAEAWHEGVVDRPAALVADGRALLVHGAGRPGRGGRGVGWASCPAPGGVLGPCEAPIGEARLVGPSDQVAAPGAPQLVLDPDGRPWLAYQARPGGACEADPCAGSPSLRVDPLCLDAGGRPRTPAPTVGDRGLSRAPGCEDDVPEGWVATWAANVLAPNPDRWDEYGFGIGSGLDDQTLRQVVHTAVGGSAARVTLSNRFGERPLHVARAELAVATEPEGSDPAVDPATARPLAFAGQAAVVVAPGEAVTSDAVTVDVPADHDVAVSLHVAAPTGPPNGHLWVAQTSFVGPGDLVGDHEGAGFTGTSTGSAFLAAVDVRADRPAEAVVVLGDSITDGLGLVPPDSGGRWTDVLAGRLRAAGRDDVAVVNVGVAGNALLPAPDPRSALGRLDRDALARSGATTLVVLLGTNDLAARPASEIVGALREVAARAAAAGLRVVGATIPPVGRPRDDATAPIPCRTGLAPPPDMEATRTAVNARLREADGATLGFDAVIDADAALRDDVEPARVACRYAGYAANFHPSPEGHRALGEAVDLAALTG